MAKKIYCANCDKYLGEIRGGSLRKGIEHSCAECAASARLYLKEYERIRMQGPKGFSPKDLGKMFGF